MTHFMKKGFLSGIAGCLEHNNLFVCKRKCNILVITSYYSKLKFVTTSKDGYSKSLGFQGCCLSAMIYNIVINFIGNCSCNQFERMDSVKYLGIKLDENLRFGFLIKVIFD